MTLAFCWSHMRRYFVECAAGQVRLTDWCQGWIERIASIYRLNEARLAHYDPGIEGKALRSLLNHREGLRVFVDRPQVPLDNNRAERVLRGPAIAAR